MGSEDILVFKCLVFVYTCFVHVYATDGEMYVFDSLRNVGTENTFRIIIAAKDRECFYQPLDYNSHIYVAFEVYKGGDRQITMMITDSKGKELTSRNRVTKGAAELMSIEKDGSAMSVCFDNSFSNYIRKHVDIYIGSWRPQDWNNYKADFELWGISANQTKSAADAILAASRAIRRSANQYRVNIGKYAALAESTLSFVNYASLLLCATILVTSSFQVYFVRRLFHVPANRPKI